MSCSQEPNLLNEKRHGRKRRRNFTDISGEDKSYSMKAQPLDRRIGKLHHKPTKTNMNKVKGSLDIFDYLATDDYQINTSENDIDHALNQLLSEFGTSMKFT
uniref:Uncharacterized protein n=1 Tax=Corethron hystrix TaxID=216773 RepID=A0A7S1B4E3_9STRA|mmetsp:Transcript_11560/g.25303  ORF Transcript_11560/g.25303 Transcript_11560/m.25303 type:complete len:102 (+) Transcript_11560:1240-1545(+)